MLRHTRHPAERRENFCIFNWIDFGLLDVYLEKGLALVFQSSASQMIFCLGIIVVYIFK